MAGGGLQPESLGGDRPGRISWCSVPNDDREASNTSMNVLKRRGWVLLPIVASMATQCDTTPRGVSPSPIASVELVLESLSAPPASDTNGFAACLNRWDVNDDENHLRPSWRSNDPVALVEASPNVFTADFPDVPVGVLNTMTVHDRNECARNPIGDGHVTMGVTVNGTLITRVVGVNALAFEVDEEGVVGPQTAP